jgi:hypothetical protein
MVRALYLFFLEPTNWAFFDASMRYNHFDGGEEVTCVRIGGSKSWIRDLKGIWDLEEEKRAEKGEMLA